MLARNLLDLLFRVGAWNILRMGSDLVDGYDRIYFKASAPTLAFYYMRSVAAYHDGYVYGFLQFVLFWFPSSYS